VCEQCHINAADLDTTTYTHDDHRHRAIVHMMVLFDSFYDYASILFQQRQKFRPHGNGAHACIALVDAAIVHHAHKFVHVALMRMKKGGAQMQHVWTLLIQGSPSPLSCTNHKKQNQIIHNDQVTSACTLRHKYTHIHPLCSSIAITYGSYQCQAHPNWCVIPQSPVVCLRGAAAQT
jgi:hypothetical protein